MKHFMYFESQDGGMGVDSFHGAEWLRVCGGGLYGWMSESCKAEDEALVRFVETAEVGDHFDHRLGMCVRLKDKVPA